MRGLLLLLGTLLCLGGVAEAEPTLAQKRQLVQVVYTDLNQMVDIGCACMSREGGDPDVGCRQTTERYWSARMARDVSRLSWFKAAIEDMTDSEAEEAGRQWVEDVTTPAQSARMAKRLIQCHMTTEDLHGWERRAREQEARMRALLQLLPQ